ncbi:phosphoribosylamine--glycine ligase [Tissierella creatinophila]|uniref:Phosphoribosylamine--glycine ligase n=1 Tax=Tissierella creatinophila DSM 6911 TaxID=1123403 RepID=A0A1U7M7A5_TISCR|nr:phosphoribosylamine--glycine ligase [Tissierella creatinophila]OLS03166.1 phosphoribosylamine--glycine ligase [Tissierella creatinophila DSM 6911]
MKILVIGSGGREHALCWKLKQSRLTSEIFCAPGNGGTREIAKNVDISANDIDSLLEFALKEKIDLTIVGPEEPLTLGIVDIFKEKGLKVFGPDKKASQLEGSKEFSKKVMEKYNIPTAKYETFTSFNEAKEGLKDFSYPLVIKADGLCLGKGVFICEREENAIKVLKDILEDRCFGDEGEKIIIEEYLEGVEASLLCFVSGNRLIPMESAKDHKKIEEGEKGLNTGGIGAFSPNNIITKDLEKQIEEEVLKNISLALKEEDLEYEGILFIGFMIDGNDIKVLEFNVRFGDPETESVLVRLKSDLVEVLLKSIDGTIEEKDLIWDERVSLCVVTTSLGYPLEYEKGFEITGLETIDEDITIFHNGTKYIDNKLFTNGGRVLTLTVLGDDLKSARDKIYSEIEKVNYKNIYYRRDIAKY